MKCKINLFVLEANYLILGKLSHKNAIKVVKMHRLRFVKKKFIDCLSNLENQINVGRALAQKDAS